MEMHFTPNGVELKRPDGWIYRLHGITGIDCRWDDWDYGFGKSYTTSRVVLEVGIHDLSDKTLDSIRVLRDEFPDHTIHLNHEL